MQVIWLRKAGRTYGEIAAQTGLSRTGVFCLCKHHEAGGAAALKDAPGGRQVDEKRLLSAEQEATVRKLIADKSPEQLKRVYALWTRQAVPAALMLLLAYDEPPADLDQCGRASGER